MVILAPVMQIDNQTLKILPTPKHSQISMSVSLYGILWTFTGQDWNSSAISQYSTTCFVAKMMCGT